MTSLLRQALAEAEALPEADQDAIAARILAEINESQWERMVAEVRRDVQIHGTRPLAE